MMIRWRSAFWDIVFAAMVIVAVPVGIFHLSQGRYAQATIAALAVAVGGYLLFAQWRRQPTESQPVIDLLMEVATPPAPVRVRVLGGWGHCPLGYRAGLASWKIGPDGRLSRGLCRPAVEALGPLLAKVPDTLGQSAICQCPYDEGRAVVFQIRNLEKPAVRAA